MGAGPTRGPFGLTLRELRGQLVILAVVLWAFAVFDASTPTRWLRSGQVKGPDFVQFYALAGLAAEGDVGSFHDARAIRRTQLAAVPESEAAWFPPVYGPQVAIALSPLGLMSYEAALLVWTAVLVVGYFVLVRLAVAEGTVVRSYVGTAMLAAAAFPPFWQLVRHGQLSIIALAAFVGAQAALVRGHPLMAGLSLGVLAYKPPLAVPVMLVLVGGRAWRMLAGAAIGAVGQLLVAAVWVGFDGLADYGRLLLSLPGAAAALATRPELMHSLRTFWELLVPVPVVAVPLYAATAIASVGAAVIVWRSEFDQSIKIAALALATVLAAPHIFVYDLVILAPAWLWLTDWYLRGPVPSPVPRVLYFGYWVTLLAPLTRMIPIQWSVPCVAILLFTLWRQASSRRSSFA